MFRRIFLSLAIVAAVVFSGVPQAEAGHGRCGRGSYRSYRTVRYYDGPSYYRSSYYGHGSYYSGHHGYYGRHGYGHHGGGLHFSFGF